MSLPADTIVALATPLGRGAVALVRISGDDACEVAGRLVNPWPLTPRRATLCAVRDPASGALLDRALVTVFTAPRSYTGEDVVEIATHGGSVVPASVIAAAEQAGARPALPGEFTRRAVLAGRLDLVQAEAIGDLVDARSGAMQRAALDQLDGGLSRRVLQLRESLLETEALLAYDIDFPEEDDGPVPRARIAEAAGRVLAQLDALLATVPAAALIRDGATVVIAGPPNAGKSSLFNALLGERRAIVTELPGTTRDAIEALLDTRPWPLRLVDTAGLRETADVVERLGIEVSERYLAAADVVLACGESGASVRETIDTVAARSGACVLPVRTKADRPVTVDDGSAALRGDRVADGAPDDEVRVSAETGAGLDLLLAAVQRAIADRHAAPVTDVPLVTRARHRRALAQARDEVAAFERAWREELLPAPVAAVHLRSAIGALDDLIGSVDVDEILGRVFASFCVGK